MGRMRRRGLGAAAAPVPAATRARDRVGLRARTAMHTGRSSPRCRRAAPKRRTSGSSKRSAPIPNCFDASRILRPPGPGITSGHRPRPSLSFGSIRTPLHARGSRRPSPAVGQDVSAAPLGCAGPASTATIRCSRSSRRSMSPTCSASRLVATTRSGARSMRTSARACTSTRPAIEAGAASRVGGAGRSTTSRRACGASEPGVATLSRFGIDCWSAMGASLDAPLREIGR